MSRRRRCQGWKLRHLGQRVKGIGRGANRAAGHLQVPRGDGQTAVPEKKLYGTNIGANLKQVRGDGAPPPVLQR